MNAGEVDVAIVGTVIVGLAHGYVAARCGLSVAVFERNPAAIGASHPEQPYLDFVPAEGVRVITVTNGLGMTMSFGIAEQTWREASVTL
jgi:2-polyprenyl-6-methoxyphenol hydroxylase-like FAD-dependent oxidoreductase